MDYKKYIVEKLHPFVEGLTEGELYDLIALPPNTEMGDYALPCFKLAKLMRKSPVMIAEGLCGSLISTGEIEVDQVLSEVTAVNGYLNFKLLLVISSVGMLPPNVIIAQKMGIVNS